MSYSDTRPAFIRAYTEKPGKRTAAQGVKTRKHDMPSEWTLIIDTETTTDHAQNLRVGVCQVRKGEELKGVELFYDPEQLAKDEITLLEAYAQKRGYKLRTVEEFRTEVFLKLAYHAKALVVGFNLPFDISRLAMSHGVAKGERMRGGFSFRLTESDYDPAIRVKHLSSSVSWIDFAAPVEQKTPRGMRKRKLSVKPKRGVFIDVKTAACALLSGGWSLHSLCNALQTKTLKLATDDHGAKLSDVYLDYACGDVQATWECYVELKRRFDSYGLDTPLHKIFSEASIGKATLEAIGAQPFLACQPDFDRAAFGAIMPTYFGGRTEIAIRRVISRVILVDFKSMYPTVNALMGLARLLFADGFTMRNTTEATQRSLEEVSLADLQQRESWEWLWTIVKLKPNRDILPLRTQYAPRPTAGRKSETRQCDALTIGLNEVSSETPLWYTLADVIASKLLSGKTPVIEEAVTFVPGQLQSSLKPIRLLGRPDLEIDPRKQDPFVALINLRDKLKSDRDPAQQQIKIIANATCYGIYVEVNRDDAPKPEVIKVFGPDGFSVAQRSQAIEQPGTYFHPVLAALITGAARLMLATLERNILDRGLDWAFCDTDSMAIAKPAGVSEHAFNEAVDNIVRWYEPLNPYDKPGSILKVEDVNRDIITGERKPLFCLPISSKRYALFNKNGSGKPVIRKASAHGLGHLMPPYDYTNPSPCTPPPLFDPQELPSKIGVSLWQHDLWYWIIVAALDGTPNQVRRDFHPTMQAPAMTRYGATSPPMLRWMDPWNEGKRYDHQVKPFNFLVALMARDELDHPVDAQLSGGVRRGRPKKREKPRPVAPFERDPFKAAERAFCRVSGRDVELEELKTYAEALRTYHFSPEWKFENGGPADKGRTQRQLVRVDGVRLIGKEANKVGDVGQSDPTSLAVAEFQ